MFWVHVPCEIEYGHGGAWGVGELAAWEGLGTQNGKYVKGFKIMGRCRWANVNDGYMKLGILKWMPLRFKK